MFQYLEEEKVALSIIALNFKRYSILELEGLQIGVYLLYLELIAYISRLIISPMLKLLRQQIIILWCA